MFNSLAISLAIISLNLAGGSSIRAASLSIHHEARVSYDFAGMRLAQWSGGALVNFASNQTAAPTLLSFDDQGKQLQALPFTIPESETVDLYDIARSPDGFFAVCGKAYDHSGRGSGFIAVVSPTGDQATTVRLYPYYPTLVTVGSDRTIWTAGVEVVNGKEGGPGINPEYGVIRHFDLTGRLLGSFIPRSSLPSRSMILNGTLRSANGRIGWYTGPIAGPGSQYYEILSDGTVRRYPSIALNKSEYVTGLALMDDGSSYATTFDSADRAYRLHSVAGPSQQWAVEPVPDQIGRGILYGGEGSRLVFHTPDHFTLIFADVSR
jgi:hypothetical protein